MSRVILSSNQFSWHKGAWVAEASDFRGRMWSFMDGFYVKSEKTGTVARFTYVDAEHDDEGDLICWNFATKDNIRIVIYND